MTEFQKEFSKRLIKADIDTDTGFLSEVMYYPPEDRETFYNFFVRSINKTIDYAYEDDQKTILNLLDFLTTGEEELSQYVFLENIVIESVEQITTSYFVFKNKNSEKDLIALSLSRSSWDKYEYDEDENLFVKMKEKITYVPA